MWPEAEAALRDVCESTDTCTTQELLYQLRMNYANLWRLGAGWCVTQVAFTPNQRKRVALASLFSGSIDKALLPEMLEAFEIWAKCYNADEMHIAMPPSSWSDSIPGWTPLVTMTRKVRGGSIDDRRVVALNPSDKIN